MAAKKSSVAEQLIAKAIAPKDALPLAARVELEALMKHNAGAVRNQRVSAEAAIGMLATYGLRMARLKFEKLVLREFGRKWGNP